MDSKEQIGDYVIFSYYLTPENAVAIFQIFPSLKILDKIDIFRRRNLLFYFQILVDKLGKGAYGVVYKAINMFEGNTVAVKKLNLKGCTKEVVDSLTVTFPLTVFMVTFPRLKLLC